MAAEQSRRIVGHIVFFSVIISDDTSDWHCLGPVSVLPEFQYKGIGSLLIHEGILKLRQFGAQGYVLVGHPGYYPRFGFTHHDGLAFTGCHRRYSSSCFLMSIGQLVKSASIQRSKASIPFLVNLGADTLMTALAHVGHVYLKIWIHLASVR